MSKYIEIYDRLTKIMGIVELIYVKKQAISINDFGDYNYIFGPYLAKSCVFNDEANAYSFYKTNDVAKINEFPNYYKFIANRNGEVFTTPTGNLIQHYFLKIDNFSSARDYSNFYEEIEDRVLDLDDKEFFSKCIRAVFLIKKKYKLPRPIANIIILKLCIVHFQNTEKYYCDCDEFIGYSDVCENCDVCSNCGTITDYKNYCRSCQMQVCNDCYTGEYCEECDDEEIVDLDNI